MRALAYAVLAFLIGYVAGNADGYHSGATRELSYMEKRNIAIDFACSRGQNWRAMTLFCGSIPKEERPAK